MQEERTVLGKIRIGDFQRLLIKVFITHAPGVSEGHFIVRHAGLIDNAITIASKEGIHVVEVPAPAIHKDAVVTLRAELLAETGEATFTTYAFDDGAARSGRDRQGDGFQPARGARAGRVQIAEVQTLLAQRVQLWAKVAGIPFAAQVLGAQALDGHQYHVHALRLAGVVDLPADT